MTPEEKKILLKDLCARLPYGVKVHIITHEWFYGEIEPYDRILDCDVIRYVRVRPYEHTVKPYLRPMLSMTEEEFKKWRKLVDLRREPTKDIFDTVILSLKNIDEVTDWLNAHHFDYRGLINKGLALEAPKGMYKNF